MTNKRSVVLSLALCVFLFSGLAARASEMDELKATVQAMQKSMAEMQKKIAALEEENRQYKHQATVSRAAVPVPAPVEGSATGAASTQTVTIAARGREYDVAVGLAATVPLGWMIGCPLLGFISDRLGRRKPVLVGGQ